jgi:hypothetical protein
MRRSSASSKSPTSKAITVIVILAVTGFVALWVRRWAPNVGLKGDKFVSVTSPVGAPSETCVELPSVRGTFAPDPGRIDVDLRNFEAAPIPTDNPDNDVVPDCAPPSTNSSETAVTIPGGRFDPGAPPPATRPLPTLPTAESVVCDGLVYPGGTRCPELVGAVWATGRTGTAVRIFGSNVQVVGDVHSESGLSLSGAGNRLAGTTRTVIDPVVSGAGNSIAAKELIQPGGIPKEFSYVDYGLTGAAVVQARQSNRLAIVAKSDCPTGVYSIQAGALRNGFVYFSEECALRVSGTASVSATLISTLSVTITGAGSTLLPAFPGMPSIYSLGNISVTGANVKIGGPLHSFETVTVSGAGAKVCGVVGKSISVTGAGVLVSPCG